MIERPLADMGNVNPDYFQTMGIPLRGGRLFVESDRNRQVALVSAVTAERTRGDQRRDSPHDFPDVYRSLRVWARV